MGMEDKQICIRIPGAQGLDWIMVPHDDKNGNKQDNITIFASLLVLRIINIPIYRIISGIDDHW